MDAHSPCREDDLNDLERRLAGWQPDPAGPGADAVLFAAGLAAGRRGRGRLLWPALCVVLAVQAAALGVWGLSERAECQALAERLHERTPAPGVPPANAVVEVPGPSYTPAPDDYFHLRRQAEQDPGRWLASLPPPGPQAIGPPPPEPAILHAVPRDGLLVP
jgi:hypothetical protein